MGEEDSKVIPQFCSLVCIGATRGLICNSHYRFAREALQF